MTNEVFPKARKFLSKRRLVLLASVAAIGATVLAGPGGYQPLTLGGTSAYAIEAAPQSGFADLIEKVKPAVISVRVKVEQDDDTVGQGGLQQQQFTDNDQLRKFFQQF